jgi:tRNA 2-selenouridine synthase
MQRAPRIEVSAPIEARADYLVSAYPDVIADRSLLEDVLSRLEVYPGRKQLANWRTLADAGDFAELVRQVVERHYDPSYTRFSKRDARPKLGTIALTMLDDAAQQHAAEQIVRMMRAD